MVRTTIKVLLIEDDEDDYILVRSLLAEIHTNRYELDWARTYEQGLEGLRECRHDTCLLDYRLGERTGIELLSEELAYKCDLPVILLTGQGDYEVDIEAMRAGAADYLLKNHISAPLLERSIRYAIGRKLAERELKKYRGQLEDLLKERTAQLEETDRNLRREIQERMKTDAAVQEGETTFREFANLLPITVFEIDTQHNVRFLNHAGLAYFRATRDDLEKGINMLDLISPQDRRRTMVNLQDKMAGKDINKQECMVMRRDGSLFPAVIASSSMLQKGKVIGLRGVVIAMNEE